MEPVRNENRKPVLRAFFLGVLTTLLVVYAWNSMPENGESWIAQLIGIAAHIFLLIFMVAVVFKFFSSIWKWLNR